MSNGIPYTFAKTFDTDGVEPNCIVLEAPYRGTLTRLIVEQVSGSDEGYTFNVYDRQDACQGMSISSSNPDDNTQLMTRRLHKIVAEVTVAAGSGRNSERFNLDAPYANRDEQNAVNRMPTRAIYIDMQPNGTGYKQFQIAYTVLQPIFSS